MFLARPINNGKEQHQGQHLTVVELKVRFINTTKYFMSVADYDRYLPYLSKELKRLF